MSETQKTSKLSTVLEEVEKAATASAQAPKQVFTIGGEEIEVLSLYGRGVGKSKEEGLRHYNESVVFVTDIIPLVTRIWATLEASGDYDFKGNDLDILAFVSDMKIPELVREIGDTIPRLVAIVAHGTRPEMTAEDVMCMAGAIYNPQLYKALFLQLYVDGLLSHFAGIAAKFSQGNVAAK